MLVDLSRLAASSSVQLSSSSSSSSCLSWVMTAATNMPPSNSNGSNSPMPGQRAPTKPLTIVGKSHRTPSIDAATAAAVGMATLSLAVNNANNNAIRVNSGGSSSAAIPMPNRNNKDERIDDSRSASLMSSSISSTFKSNASQFLKKYYCSKEDIPHELAEADLIDDYELGPVVGMGAFSIVRRAVNIYTSENVAIKIISKVDSENDVVDMVANETAVWSTVNHPNIIQLLRVIETRSEVCIVSELADGGSFLDYVVNSEQGHLNEDEARPLFRQLFSVLAECHRRGVVHGDVKPDNLLMSENNKSLKLCDFGLSFIIDRTKSPLFDDVAHTTDDYFTSHRGSISPKSATNPAGTPLYLAPEMIQTSPDAGTKSDMWSAGVTLYAALTGRYPFDDDFTPRLQHKILNSDFELPEHLSLESRDLISQLLNKNPILRPSADEVCQHPWFRDLNCGVLSPPFSLFSPVMSLPAASSNIGSIAFFGGGGGGGNSCL